MICRRRKLILAYSQAQRHLGRGRAVAEAGGSNRGQPAAGTRIVGRRADLRDHLGLSDRFGLNPYPDRIAIKRARQRMPQARLLHDTGGHLLVNRLHRLEDLARDASPLARDPEHPFDPPHANTSTGTGARDPGWGGGAPPRGVPEGPRASPPTA